MDHPTARWPSEESPEMTGNAVFSEGRTLCVRVAGPHECRGIAFQPDAEARGRWPTGHMPRSSPCPHCGRAQPAPPRGDHPRVRWPCGGRPGDGARGGSLGGTHSVRPHCKAGRKSRHNIIIGGKRTPGGLMGQSPGGREAFLAGVQSPPLRGVDHPTARWPCGGNPGITLGAVFAEGRTLCVRVARPC